MDSFLIEENLDARYEVRNNMSNLGYEQLLPNDFISEDHFQTGSLAMMPHSSPIKPNLVSSFVDDNSDPSDPSNLDDIDPNSLFYVNNKKSFTELRPLKSENHESESNVMNHLLTDNNFGTLDIPYDCYNLSGDSASYSTNHYMDESPFQEVDSWTTFTDDQYKFYFEDSMVTNEENVIQTIKLEQMDPVSPPAQTGSYLNSFENEFLSRMHIKHSPTPLPSLPSDYMSFGDSSASPEPHFYSSYDMLQPDFEEQDSDVSSSPRSCSSLQDELPAGLTLSGGESSWVKEIKVGKNHRPRGPKCWEFLLRILKDPAANPSLVKWEDKHTGSFRLVEKDRISTIWGNRPSKKKNGRPIKYESFARILRYHYKKGRGMVLPVSEKHLVYKFAPRVMDMYRTGRVP